eukprot:4298469-Prymnesium_polylepis.3
MWLPTGRTFAWGRVGVGQRAQSWSWSRDRVLRCYKSCRCVQSSLFVSFLSFERVFKLGSSMELDKLGWFGTHSKSKNPLRALGLTFATLATTAAHYGYAACGRHAPGLRLAGPHTAQHGNGHAGGAGRAARTGHRHLTRVMTRYSTAPRTAPHGHARNGPAH